MHVTPEVPAAPPSEELEGVVGPGSALPPLPEVLEEAPPEEDESEDEEDPPPLCSGVDDEGKIRSNRKMGAMMLRF